MRVDAIIDTICPWCFIGKVRFGKALAQRPRLEVEIVWRPFQLNPQMPPGGKDRKAYLAERFGGIQRAQRQLHGIDQSGRQEGIAFRFDRIERTPNTLQSHRLIAYAARHGLHDRVVEALFRAYFLDGRDIGDRATLVEIGDAAGLAAGPLATWLDGAEERQRLIGEDENARRLGVNGVPCFVIDGRYAVSGAQSPEVFVQVLDLALQDGWAQAAE